MPSEKLLETIRRNCDISDARDAGNFSLCTLFLRLRNIYKWEIGSRATFSFIDRKEERGAATEDRV